MAEDQAKHRQSLEVKALDSRVFMQKAGLFTGAAVALAVLATAAYIAGLGHPIPAAFISIADLTGLVAIFVTGSRGRETSGSVEKQTDARSGSKSRSAERKSQPISKR